MPKLLMSALFLLCTSTVFGQVLYEVQNLEKERNSTLILEGQVVEQASFWNPAHRMIYTSNKIKVYKIFKGALSTDFIEVVTKGGTVDNDNIIVSELLELNIGETGILFCHPNSFNLRSASGSLLFDVYASAQGFIKYNVEGNKAADPFNRFSSITNEVYPYIQKLTGKKLSVKDGSLIIGNNENALNRTTAVITSFSPATVNAGAIEDPGTNVLTITGTGFGVPGGTAAVKFSDANSGIGSDVYYSVASNSNLIVSWTDTEIKVRVPGRAGTGNIVVQDAAGNESKSFEILDVFYSIIDVSFSNAPNVVKQANLINANGQGGYTILYSNNLNEQATVTFNRALKTWVDLSGFNVTKGNTTPIQYSSSDGNCVLFMDNSDNGEPLPAGVLAVCTSYFTACSSIATNPVRKPEFDITIRSSYSVGNTNFSYGPCPPSSISIDLETVILHELGHALNLGHINDGPEGSGNNRNPNKLMYYAVSTGVKRVSPDASAYQGSIYTCSTNASLNFGSCTTAESHNQLPVTRDAKDECPLVFPTSTTQQGTQVIFDLEHATSNKIKDPRYTNVLCTSLGTNVTNNLYYVFRTDAAGTLSLTVSDFTVVPVEAANCTGASIPTVRISIYQVNTCPDGEDFPDVLTCRMFTANGPIADITGLAGNTNYLMYVDGRANTKATFKLTLGGNALPIKLERFAGEIKGTVNELKWKIASYSDVSRINLEKSANGRDFTSIKEFDGNLSLANEYTYTDARPFTGNNYYRLATKNKDGSVQYSNVVLLKRTEKIKFNFYPVPVVSNINVTISSVEDLGPIRLKLFNSVGQLVITKSANVTAGTTNIDVRADKLSAGVYRLVVIDKNNQILESHTLQKM